MARLIVVLLGVLFLAFAARWLMRPIPQDYAAETPRFVPEQFFNGELQSWGVIRDWKGHATRRFTMQQTDRWTGNRATLDEAFQFADGKKAERHWTITKIDDRHYIGTAPDVIGEAKGEVAGNALHWVYDIRVPQESGIGQDKEIVVTFDDWLYLVDERTLFSFVHIRKFGLPVGEMTMVFRKGSAL